MPYFVEHTRMQEGRDSGRTLQEVWKFDSLEALVPHLDSLLKPIIYKGESERGNKELMKEIQVAKRKVEAKHKAEQKKELDDEIARLKRQRNSI